MSHGKNTCPHCGKKQTISNILVATITTLIALLFWHALSSPESGKIQETPLPATRFSEATLAYMESPEADKSCGACVQAAKKFQEKKAEKAVNEKTKGMALIPAGEYISGSPAGTGDPDEHPQRKLQLSAFYIDKTEVTISEYMKWADSVGGESYPEWARPGGKFNIDTGTEGYYKRLSQVFKDCPSCPIVGVNFKNAEDYCKSRNKRLPTEAEWEAAARGAASGDFSFGENLSKAWDYAWNESNAGSTPHQAGTKQPNAYGIYDMHGNVWEWVADYYDKTYYTISPKRDPTGPETGKERVIRGGSWAFGPDAMRLANRAHSYKPNDDIGFRCAVSENALEMEENAR